MVQLVPIGAIYGAIGAIYGAILIALNKIYSKMLCQNLPVS